MPEKTSVERAVLAAFERDPVIDLHRFPIQVEFDFSHQALRLSGEVRDIVAKKRAFEIASLVNGVRGIMDQIRVVPTQRRGDGAIRDSVTETLLDEPALRSSAIRVWNKGTLETLRENGTNPGDVIDVSVRDALVLLHGRVGSLTHRRFAGVLAWWVPGVCDVINELEVVPPEADTDGEIADAVRIVLEKDPLVHSDRIAIRVREEVVTLAGSVSTLQERHMAELDAWYVAGVNRVENRITVYR
jgi:osmotically-inducible protein OsmY